jgi:hypothetical protein
MVFLNKESSIVVNNILQRDGVNFKSTKFILLLRKMCGFKKVINCENSL